MMVVGDYFLKFNEKLYCLSSSVVEPLTVNQVVVGSNPTWDAKNKRKKLR